MNPQSNQTQLIPSVGTGGSPNNQQPGLAPVINTNPNSTQNTLQVAEIRDGIVIMRDGSYRSVIMAQSINFDLMSPQEREAVEFGYQGFLNSLYFPIQVFIRSKRVDMRPYLERLDNLRTSQENMLLGLLMDDYINYIAALVEQANIMDKQFYVVIPYFSTIDITKPIEAGKKAVSGFAELFKFNKSARVDTVVINEQDLEKAKQELRNRVQSVINGLSQMGVQSAVLDTQELIELYYDFYNPDTATRQNLSNMNELTAPIIEKATRPPSSTGRAGVYQ